MAGGYMKPALTRNVSRKIILFTRAVFFMGIYISFPCAKTTQVNDCSISSVKTAIANAQPGDIISLPSGTSNWSSALLINKKNLTLKGNGIGSTVITCGTKTISLTGESANNLRITGIEFRGGSQMIFASGMGTPRQAIKNLRVDHCKFTGTYIAIETNGGATGVFDHCVFENTYGARLYGSNNAVARPPYRLGTDDAMFFEDNTINVTPSGNPPHFIASNSFSKYVVRHNTFSYQKSLWDIVDAHGACEVKGRGSATWEIYDNTFKIIPSMDRVIHLRGGQGVVFNNIFEGYTPSKPITITDYATCNGPCTQNCHGSSCPDLINHAYFWKNKVGSKEVDPVNACSSALQLNRDYFYTEMPGYIEYPYPHPLTMDNDITVETDNSIAQPKLLHNEFSILNNKFDGSTKISYNVNTKVHVKLSVYTIDGNLISVLEDKLVAAGQHETIWKAEKTPPGLYILRTNVDGIEKSYSFSR
jgi:hypothetical protein